MRISRSPFRTDGSLARALVVPAAFLSFTAAGCDHSEPTALDPDPGARAFATAVDGDEGSQPRGGEKRYRVTIHNLTTGQPFSPGVVATHTKQKRLFAAGSAASEGIRLIAEDGDPTTAFEMLSSAAEVHDVVATSMPVGCADCPGPFGTMLELELTARGNANRLSVAVMLICTNDGFVGLDGVKLPGGFEPVTFPAFAYDAGTEVNDELTTSLVDPCGAIGPVPHAGDGNARTATGGAVAAHSNITGGGDLDATAHGWTEPVAHVTVERLR